MGLVVAILVSHSTSYQRHVQQTRCSDQRSRHCGCYNPVARFRMLLAALGSCYFALSAHISSPLESSQPESYLAAVLHSVALFEALSALPRYLVSPHWRV